MAERKAIYEEGPRQEPVGSKPAAAVQEKTATQEKIDEYVKGLNSSIKNTDSEATVKQTELDKCLKKKEAADRSYKRTKGGYDKYKWLNIGDEGIPKPTGAAKASSSRKVQKPDEPEPPETPEPGEGRAVGASALDKCASESKDLIGEMKDILKKELDGKLDAAMKGLKDLGAKIKALNEAFCKVEAEIGNNCNSLQLNLLRDEIDLQGSAPCGRPNPPGSPVPAYDFDKWIDRICNDVKESVKEVNARINEGVQVASINATVNFDNLKLVGDAMSTSLSSLKKDTTDNLDFFDGKTKEDCKAVTDASVCITEYWFDLQSANLKLQGLYKACNDLNNMDCESDWEEIREKVKELVC
jgi:copper chaperone CopZ